MNEETLVIDKKCESDKIFTFWQLTQEKIKSDQGQPFNKRITSIYDRIETIDLNDRNQDSLYVTEKGKYISFKEISHKLVYEELIKMKYLGHHSEPKWVEKLTEHTDWDQVWIPNR